MSKNTNLSFLTDYITADITNGRIGINTPSPAYAFDVTGIARTSTSTYLATASGNVGIGTTSPSDILHILKSSTGNIDTYLDNPNTTAANGARFIFRTTDSTGAIALNAGGIRTIFNSRGASTVDNDIIISTRGADNIIVAKNNGNVGIGTSTPATYTGWNVFTVNGATNGGMTILQYQGTNGLQMYSASTETGIYELRAYPLIFGTNNTERMRITSGGLVAIGVSTALSGIDSTLTVKGTGIFQTASAGANYNENLRLNRNANNSYSSIAMGGAYDSVTGTGVGQWTLIVPPAALSYQFRFDYNGTNVATLTTSGVWSTTGGGTSDLRKKQNIEYIQTDGIYSINLLKPVKFEFIDNPEKTRRGFIAQDVLEVIPNLVLGDGELEGGTYGLDYDGILALAVKAIQELSAEITILKNK